MPTHMTDADNDASWGRALQPIRDHLLAAIDEARKLGEKLPPYSQELSTLHNLAACINTILQHLDAEAP